MIFWFLFVHRNSRCDSNNTHLICLFFKVLPQLSTLVSNTIVCKPTVLLFSYSVLFVTSCELFPLLWHRRAPLKNSLGTCWTVFFNHKPDYCTRLWYNNWSFNLFTIKGAFRSTFSRWPLVPRDRRAAAPCWLQLVPSCIYRCAIYWYKIILQDN